MPDSGARPVLIDLLDVAERVVRNYFKDRPRGEWSQTIHARLPGNRDALFLAPVLNRTDKATMYAALSTELKGLSAIAYCISAESWQGPAFKSMEEADPWIGRMHEHPNRLEVVMLAAVHQDGLSLLRVLIMKRAPNGSVHELERVAPDLENIAGSATNLLAHRA